MKTHCPLSSRGAHHKWKIIGTQSHFIRQNSKLNSQLQAGQGQLAIESQKLSSQADCGSISLNMIIFCYFQPAFFNSKILFLRTYNIFFILKEWEIHLETFHSILETKLQVNISRTNIEIYGFQQSGQTKTQNLNFPMCLPKRIDQILFEQARELTQRVSKRNTKLSHQPPLRNSTLIPHEVPPNWPDRVIKVLFCKSV